MRVPVLRRLVRRPIFIVPLVVVTILIGARAALPMFVTDYVNGVISSIPDVRGGIEDVDLSLWRGAYAVRGLRLVQAQGQKQIPVLSVPTIDFSIEWKTLLRGALVGQITFDRPRINVIAGAEKKQARGSGDLIDRFHELIPLRINSFVLRNADIHFRDPSTEPDVDIFLDRVELVARNLTNSERISETLTATVSGKGRAMRSGLFTIEMRLDPRQRRPTYELAFELKDLSLPELNNFLKHYLSVVVHDGKFSMYVESTASQGKFRGYVKPLTRDLDYVEVNAEKQGALAAVKGFVVKIVANLFKNEPKEQLASKIEFSGTFEDPDISVWEAVTSFLRNAFVQALEPRLEGSHAPAQADEAARAGERSGRRGSDDAAR